MGCFFAKVDVVTVTEDPKDPRHGLGFSRSMFKPKEWHLLKTFCNKKGIYQTDLNHVFNKYLSGDDVYLRQFRIDVMETKKKYMEFSLLNFEISDIFLPNIFMRPFHGLEKPSEATEATFPRFIVLGYTFCAQPMTDLIYEYFSILRQNYRLQLGVVMYSFNVKETISVLSEELEQDNSGIKYVLLKINPANDTEYSVEDVIRMGLRYPIMFYPLQRFRIHFRRQIFGDKFWEDKKVAKTRFVSAFGEMKGKQGGYESEAAANQITAVSVINDFAETLNQEALAEKMKVDRRATMIATAQALGEEYVEEVEEDEVEEEGDDDDDDDDNNNENEEEKKEVEQETAPNQDGEDEIKEKRKKKKKKDKKKDKAFISGVTGTKYDLTTPAAKKRLKSQETMLLHAKVPHANPGFVTKDVAHRMKRDMGYTLARDLILDSKLPYAEGVDFLVYPEELDEEVRIHDTKVNRDFVYNTGTGIRAWVRPFVFGDMNDDDYDLVHEVRTKINPLPEHMYEEERKKEAERIARAEAETQGESYWKQKRKNKKK